MFPLLQLNFFSSTNLISFQQDTKHVNLAHFDFDSKYGKKALDEMLKKIRGKEQVSSFPELSAEVERETMNQINGIPELAHLFRPVPGSRYQSFEAELKDRPDGALYFSEAAIVWLYLVGFDVTAQDNFTVAKFLNRILGLQYDRQNYLFQVCSLNFSFYLILYDFESFVCYFVLCSRFLLLILKI